MKYLRLIGFCLMAIAMSQSALAAKVYTWTDSKGVVHFGERPPKDVKATPINARTGHSDPTPAPTPITPAPAATQTPNNAQSSLKDPVRCTQARDNLAILNSVARIKTVDEKGITVYLTEEDKAKQREAMQLVMNQACE